MPFFSFFSKIDYELFRVIGLKYDKKSPYGFEFKFFSLMTFIVPHYLYGTNSDKLTE